MREQSEQHQKEEEELISFAFWQNFTSIWSSSTRMPILKRNASPVLPLTITSQATENPFHPCAWRCLLFIGVLLYGSYSILMHLCEENKKIPFSSSSVVFMTEFAKLVFSAGLTATELSSGSTLHELSLWACLPFSIPALLYCINNNIAVHMQIQMDPATFQILSNLKIITTALLYKLIIQRPITKIQWFSLVLLTVAGISHSYGSLHDKEDVTNSVYVTWLGLAMMILYCIFSGLAGVYSEYILKRHKQLSLALQNVILYVFGVMFNGLLYRLSMDEQGTKEGFFTGYSVVTWVIIVTQAVNGLIISVIMKHSNNITRLFVISSAMIVTTVLSVAIFSLKINLFLGVACVLVISALIIYHH